MTKIRRIWIDKKAVNKGPAVVVMEGDRERARGDAIRIHGPSAVVTSAAPAPGGAHIWIETAAFLEIWTMVPGTRGELGPKLGTRVDLSELRS